MRDFAAMADEWRVELDLDDEEHGLTLGERLRSVDLDDQARERLGGRVVVTRDGPRMFLYATSENEAREAERVVRELIAEDQLSADVAVTRWHPDEEAWKDASAPMPSTPEEHAAEQSRHEAAEESEALRTGTDPWEVRVDLPSLKETLELGGRLADEGLDVHRRWRYLLIGAPSEDRANELAERLRGEAPQGSSVRVEPRDDVPHPAFVFFASRTPRDLI